MQVYFNFVIGLLTVKHAYRSHWTVENNNVQCSSHPNLMVAVLICQLHLQRESLTRVYACESDVHSILFISSSVGV